MVESDIVEQLGAANGEITRLRQRLYQKEQECQDLLDDCNFKAARSWDLEQQCKDRSAKAAELMEILGAKTPDAMGEKLLVKGLQNAEFTFHLRSLRQKLEHTEAELEMMKTEREKNDEMVSHITEKSAMLSLRLDEELSKRERLVKERDSYKTMVLELSDVVRSLNCISVSYDKEEGMDEKSPSSAEQSQLMSMRNVKRKVEAIEKDRQLLIRENECLVEEIAARDKRIKALEGQYHFLNTARLEDGDAESLSKLSVQGRSSSRRARLSTIEAIAEVQEDTVQFNADGVEGRDQNSLFDATPNPDRSSWCSGGISQSSSFSSIEPPDIPFEKYEKLRQEHQVAMHNVAELEKELRDAKGTLSSEGSGFEEPNLEEADFKKLYKVASMHIAKLEDKLEEAKEKVEQANLKYDTLKQEYDASLVSHVAQYMQFKKDYESESTAHEQKFGALNEKYLAAVDRHTIEFSQLKAANEEANEMHKLEHDTTLKIYTERYKQLKDAYDDLAAMHDEDKDQLEIQKEAKTKEIEHYESLTRQHGAAILRIKSLEDDLDEARRQHEQEIQNALTRFKIEEYQNLERELREISSKSDVEAREELKKATQQYKQDLLEHTKLEKELRAVTHKAEKRSKEQYDELKQAYDAIQADLKSSKEELAEIKQKAELGSSADFRKLQESHVDALAKISDLELELLETDWKNEAKGDREDVMNWSSPDNRSSNNETGKRKNQDEKNSDCCVQDTRIALKNLEKLETELLQAEIFNGEEIVARVDYSMNDYLHHHLKLKQVHASIFQRFTSAGGGATRDWSDHLAHQRKLSVVIYELRSILFAENGDAQVQTAPDQTKSELQGKDSSHFSKHEQRVTNMFLSFSF
jgi:hypothetical protein